MTSLQPPATSPTGPTTTASDHEIAISWCRRAGPQWTAEAIPTDDGRFGLFIAQQPDPVTARGPHGDDEAGEYAVQIERTAEGFAVFDAKTWQTIGVFPSVGLALDAGAGAGQGVGCVTGNA